MIKSYRVPLLIFISFAIADMREDTEELREGLAYGVELTDTEGNTVSISSPVLVYHTLAVQLYKQDAIFGSYEYKHQLQTVRIYPSMFGTEDNSSVFDFSNVVAMKLSFDGQTEGNVIINNIGYWSEK